MKISLIYMLLFSTVIVRFFTETIRILPRFFNFTDLVLLLVSAYVLLWHYAVTKKRGFEAGKLGTPLVIFAIITIISLTLNTMFFQNPILPALAFLGFHLEPILFALIFLNLNWNEQDSQHLSRILVGLTLLQIPIGLAQIPIALAERNPDLVAGTFGVNGSQMSYFLVLGMGYLLGRYFMERKSQWLLPLPLILIVFYAAGFKAMWVSLILTLVLASLIVPGRIWRQGLTASLIFVPSVIIALYVGAKTSESTVGFFRDLLNPQILLELGKVQAFLNVFRLYQEVPSAIILGVGPGSYSSRAFRVFVQPSPGAAEFTNVVRDYISPIPPSIWSQKFVIPLIFKSFYLLGSGTVDGPFSSYLSLLAEVGISGFLAYAWLYYRTFKVVRDVSRRAWQKQDACTFAFSLAGITGLLFLFLMALTDNWFEVSRVVVPLWLSIVPVLAKSRMAK